MISPQLKFDIKSEIIIDNFAGSECASTGILWLWRTTMTKIARQAFSGCLSSPPTLTKHKTMASAPMHHPPQAACCAAHLEVIK